MLEKPHVQDRQQQQQGHRVNPGVSDEHSSPGSCTIVHMGQATSSTRVVITR